MMRKKTDNQQKDKKLSKRHKEFAVQYVKEGSVEN